jgi:hypothetical protein
MNKFNVNIPAKSITYLIVCTGIILFIILVGIVNLYRFNSNRAYENKKIRQQIEEQKGLKPLYLALQKATDNKDVSVLPNPKMTTLPREDAGKFQETFRLAATKSGMMTVSLTPELGTLTGSSSSLLYNAVVKGEFSNFRNMLIGLGGVSYVQRIEEINIRQYSDSMEFRLKIWIALGS